jgi:RNA recognition motif-containing protein
MNLENTLWMGGLLPGTTESQILDSFKYFNIFPVNIKLIRDKIKNKNKSYCFITFKSFEEAKNVLDFLDGKQIPNSNLIFRLNWSDYQGANKTVYVGGLSPNITKEDLFLFFKQKYKSVHNARIILDEKEISKGYGFVNFKSDREYYLCLKEMNGVNFCGNIIKVKEQIKKDEDYYNGNNKKKKGNNINNNNSFNEKNIYNTIFIKNNLININSFTNNNDINLQNNINKYNNNRNNFMIKGNNPNLNNNFIGNVNNICDKMQNSYVNRNNINYVFNSEINNIPNLNSNQLNECLINKKNSSSFFMKNNKNHENLKMANSESNLLINPKSNQNEPKKQSIPEKSVINKNNENKEQKNIKIKNKNNGRKKFKLEVLEIIDEITLYKKIHESILRTFSYNQMQILKNGIKYKSK